jgi:isoquinoline 1-oxidoreductase beta subunit
VEPRLKSPADFGLIGTAAASKDAVFKVDGSAVFGIDVELPGMLHGAVRQSPVFGCEVSNYDEQQAISMPGVHAVVPVPSGLVVVADSYWQARKALDALDITFEESPNAKVDSQQISTMLHKALTQDGEVVNSTGNPKMAFADAASVVEAVYETPFLAHATMEPMNCTASVKEGECKLWVGVQTPEFVRYAVAKLLGAEPAKVTLNMTFLGGGFGRRGSDDFVFHAVLASKAVGRPVKVIWSREEDMQHDLYRHAATARLKAALGPGGELLAIDARVAMRPLDIIPYPAWYCVGIIDQDYAIPNTTVDFVATDYPVPVGAWRSTTYSNNTFALECFVDEIAAVIGRDPYSFRRELLSAAPRALHTLDLAAEKAGWDQPARAGHSVGIVCAHHRGAYAALAVEISISDGVPKVHRVVFVACPFPIMGIDITIRS